MKICSSEALKKHFENLVDVKLFTAAQICTIIDTFSVTIPEGTKLVMTRSEGRKMVKENLEELLNRKPEIVGGGRRYEK